MAEFIQEISLEQLATELKPVAATVPGHTITSSQFPRTVDTIHMLQRAGVIQGDHVRVILHSSSESRH
ncbi:MAG TPA: hypothetical protein VFT64_00155 [Rickettsiales bacterium]|nr:hypothetical protein [Rickettsiales bacterium]